MTRYSPLWQQANTYAATLDRSLIGALYPLGYCCVGGLVTAVANTTNVQAAAGTVAVPLQSGQSSALCRWDTPASDSTVDLTKGGAAPFPPSGQSRIDRIVVQVRDNALDSGGNNDFIVTSVTGTAATTGSQVAPAMPANAFLLCEVTVPGAAANLNAATLTDRRLGQWWPLPLQSGWIPFSGYAPPQYRVDERGRGWLTGAVQVASGTSSGGNAAQLPAPLVPVGGAMRWSIAATQSGTITGPPTLTVNTTGQVSLSTASAAPTTPFFYVAAGPWDTTGPYW